MHRPLLMMLIMLAAVGGCGKKKLPPLHPVEGTVFRQGSAVGNGGSLHLAPMQEDLQYTLTAEIDLHGRFKVSAVDTQDKSGKPQPGAPEGIYRVTYHPANADEHNTAVELEATFTVQAGKNNEWKIELVK